MYSHISKAVSDVIWAATVRSQLTYWVNKPKPFSAQQSSVWGLKYKVKPLVPRTLLGAEGGLRWCVWYLLPPSSFLRQWHCWDIHYHTLGWRPKCVLSPDVILYLLLGHCGNTSVLEELTDYWPSDLHVTLQSRSRCQLVSCSALLQYKDANTGVLFEECSFRQLRGKSSTSSVNNWLLDFTVTLILCLSPIIMSYYL